MRTSGSRETDLELMRLHVAALFTHDAMGRMRRANEPGGAVAPVFFLGRTAVGNEWRFRHDVGDDLLSELATLCVNEPVGDHMTLPPYGSTPYSDVLAQYGPIQNLWTGPAYHFPGELPTAVDTALVTVENADVLRPHFEDWLGDIPHCQPFMALVQDGRAVSICCSVRITTDVHEAGVETSPDFRGRGYAGEVVASWANAVRRIGPIPLYSTSWENGASRAVAERLGLVRYGTDFHIT